MITSKLYDIKRELQKIKDTLRECEYILMRVRTRVERVEKKINIQEISQNQKEEGFLKKNIKSSC